ncbi:MAG TPA: hypothetical protein VGD14_09305, partial [bacterium]
SGRIFLFWEICLNMDIESNFSGIPQLPLFDVAEKSIGTLELFPELWGAAEALTSSNSNERLAAIERLSKWEAARLSPLITYLMATRLDDPDMCCRSKVVRVLGEVLGLDQHGHLIPEGVRQRLINILTFNGTEEIRSILEVLNQDGELEIQVVRILKTCPTADTILMEILSSRTYQVSIRKWAARLIGKIGYTEVVNDLEHLLGRLEMRANGQQLMPFATVSNEFERSLIPEIKQALAILQMP